MTREKREDFPWEDEDAADRRRDPLRDRLPSDVGGDRIETGTDFQPIGSDRGRADERT